jgi:hypothetical protein
LTALLALCIVNVVDIVYKEVAGMEIDYLILSDGAQVVGDKLYLLGGGWMIVNAQQFPVVVPMAIAVAILVGWNETNRRHQVRVEIFDEDAKTVTFKVEAEFEQGRPPGIPLGIDQRVQMAFSLPMSFQKAGPFVARAYLNGHEAKRTPFMVNDMRTQVAVTPPQPDDPGPAPH